MNTTLRHTRLVFGRQVRAALRDPGPSFVLPALPSILMLVVFTSVFDPLTGAEGYDAAAFTASGWDGYVVPGVIVLVALLGAGYTSSSLASDLRSGYIDRLTLSRVGTGPHLVGRLLFEAIRLLPGLLIVLGIGFAVGGEADNGLVGVIVLVILVAALGVAFTGIFHVVAIKSEDPQTPFAMQPLGLPLAFLSSALVPLAIMPDWSRSVAEINPVSVVVDAARHAMVGDLGSSRVGAAAAVLALWVGLSQLLAWRLLHNRTESRP